jgi:hypothetical protein
MKRILLLSALLAAAVSTAGAANYTINNPAGNIVNPAGSMANPAEQLANPNPLVPMPTQTPQPVVQVKPAAEKPALPLVMAKYYTFKRVKDYLDAAKKAFARDDYTEFTTLAEDALRRINSGGLKASRKTIRKLEKFRDFGYALLAKDED